MPKKVVGSLLTCPLILALLICDAAPGQQAVPAVKTSAEIYQLVAPSTLAFLSNNRVNGSGVLIDAKERWAMTAYHVVHEAIVGSKDIYAFFPEKKDGRLINDVAYYLGPHAEYEKRIRAALVYGDFVRDLALLKLDSLPAGVAQVPLAASGPQPGERVHVIGNSTRGHGGLFGYNQGFVRNAYLWAYAPHFYFALAHHSPTNHGDSGGPTVNDRGELVALVSEGTDGTSASWWANQQVIDHGVHVSEIRALLDRARAGKPKYQLPAGTTCVLTAATNFNHGHFGYEDVLIVPARKGTKVSLSLKGSKVSDLDLFADGGRGANLVAKTGTTDQEEGDFTPGWDGAFRARVRNLQTQDTLTKFAERTKKGETIEADERRFTKENLYTLTVSSANVMAGPITLCRAIMANHNDDLQVHYVAGQGEARVRLIGDGDTDLDVYVFAPDDMDKKAELVRGTSHIDRESVVFEPKVTGLYTIRVRNLGATWNRYCLTTD